MYLINIHVYMYTYMHQLYDVYMYIPVLCCAALLEPLVTV